MQSKYNDIIEIDDVTICHVPIKVHAFYDSDRPDTATQMAFAKFTNYEHGVTQVHEHEDVMTALKAAVAEEKKERGL